jgi:Raf kinase inhibitor-like YbhB/YbcL family protein
MNAIRLAVAAAALIASAGTAAAFELSSSSLGPDGGTFPTKYVANIMGCPGQNVSPALAWKDAPAGTKSFAITMYDPDAPTGSGFWHWIAADIPPDVTALPEGAASAGGKGLPAGVVQARDDAGLSHYLGPCPPIGDKPHHYIITVFAVKKAKLGIDKDTSGAGAGFALHFATLGKASLTYTYGR